MRSPVFRRGNKMKKSINVLLTVCLLAGSAYAYGPQGHSLVGAIADRRLAKNKDVAKEIAEHLDGVTLERAATLPDEMKSWDSKNCGNKNPSNRAIIGSAKLNGELRAFFKANLCDSKPSHHEFHYTDVPVTGGEDYDDGTVGRGDFDVVQMIPYCIRVLKGEVPEENERAITKGVAIVLLTHYLGDIHQPLHVGAEFFDADGEPFRPTASNHGFEDQGGNKLTLFTFFNGQLTSAGKFHGYWDSQTVRNAFGDAANSTVANQLARKEPAGWRLSGAAETWAEKIANEMLPVAREAHTRLQYADVETKSGAKFIVGGRAEERKPKPGGKFYAVWAHETAKKGIHKAGWRLAAILEESLR